MRTAAAEVRGLASLCGTAACGRTGLWKKRSHGRAILRRRHAGQHHPSRQRSQMHNRLLQPCRARRRLPQRPRLATRSFDPQRRGKAGGRRHGPCPSQHSRVCTTGDAHLQRVSSRKLHRTRHRGRAVANRVSCGGRGRAACRAGSEGVQRPEAVLSLSELRQHSSLAGFFAANFSDFQPHTNGSLEETLACLRRVQDRPALLAEAELLAGWYLRDDTLLGRADLRNFIPVQHCFFDPMHCYYSCGLIACEAGLFLAKCRELIGLRQEHIDRLGATGFQQPQQQGRPKQVLHASLLKLTSQDYKGNAGQCKLLLPLLAYLASDVLGPGVENETRSLLALHRCCLLLEALKCRPSESLLQELEVWQARHLEYFVEAHSRERVRPKHHYSRHVPSQIRTAGFVFDTWTTERKHRRLKLDVAPHQKRLDRFSRDSLASLIEQDFCDAKPTLQKPELEKHLCLQWPGRVVLWSNSLEVEGRKLDSGMYLLDRYQVAVKVLRFLQLDDTAHMAVIQPLQPLVRNAHWSRWQPDTGKKEQVRLLQELLHAQRPSWQLQENNGWLLLH